MNLHQPTRRDFLKTMAAGGLLIAVGAPTLAHAEEKIAAENAWANAWVRIGKDGWVTVLSNTSELGQGTGTAIAQILANELDLDWTRVRLEMAPVEKQYYNALMEEYGTYGSFGIRLQFDALRKSAAQGRAVLIQAAALEWKVAPADCETELGFVVKKQDGTKLAYQKLVEAAARLPLPAEPGLMPKERWRYIGKDSTRFDLPEKVDGSAIYGVDVQLPGLLIATISQCPSFGGQLKAVDSAPALAIPGVKQVVALENAVAVVASGYWPAKKGLEALKPEWDLSKASKTDSEAYAKRLAEGTQADGHVFVPRNSTEEKVRADYEAALPSAVTHHEALYSVPFLHHATMEPMNATVRLSEKSAEVWVPTQSQSSTRDRVAKELGLAPEAVALHSTMVGGGFGRRIEADYVMQALQIAKKVGAPIKLIWSREEDVRHGFYRPAAAIRVRAGLTADGQVVALRHDSACEAIMAYSRDGMDRELVKTVDFAAVSRSMLYNIPGQLFTTRTVDGGIPTGWWRSVAESQNGFARECFIDELARAAKQDPLQFRMRNLDSKSRVKQLLEALRDASGWDRPAEPGRFRGLALSETNGTSVGHVVELSLLEGKKVKLHKVTSVLNPGIAVNPRNIQAQVEGGVCFGITAAFTGEISLEKGAVQQSNFHDYPLIRLADLPPIQVLIQESGDKPGGIGEEAVGPIIPAVVNALVTATGSPIRSLPLSKAGYSLV